MANKFWVGGTGTWDNSDTTHWATSTGGAGGTAVPTTGDNVTFDGSSGGGTVSVSATISGLSLATLTGGAFTGTLDFSVGNPNITLTSSMFLAGSGTRSINLGSGTWTLSATSGNVISNATVTGLTATFSNASFVLSGSALVRGMQLGGLTYGPLTINNNATKGIVTSDAGTFASITVGNGNTLMINQSTTLTVSGALTMTGTSSAPVGLVSSTSANNATISVGSASTIIWGSILRVTRSGAGTLDATNAFDLGGNTSFTSISAPSGGGGGVVGVIGG